MRIAPRVPVRFGALATYDLSKLRTAKGDLLSIQAHQALALRLHLALKTTTDPLAKPPHGQTLFWGRYGGLDFPATFYLAGGKGPATPAEEDRHRLVESILEDVPYKPSAPIKQVFDSGDAGAVFHHRASGQTFIGMNADAWKREQINPKAISVEALTDLDYRLVFQDHQGGAYSTRWEHLEGDNDAV